MKNNKFIKFLSTLLVAILIVSIAPINDAVVTEMKNSTNSVIKNIGEAVGNIDFTLPEFDVKAEAAQDYNYDFRVDEKTATLYLDGDGYMPSYANGDAPWRDYKDIENLVIEGDFTILGTSAFEGFTKLKNVKMTGAVLVINASVFKDCSSLENVEFSDCLAGIFGSAFANCTSLKSIVIPENVTCISSNAFKNCPLEEITLPFTGGGPQNDSAYSTTQIGYIFSTTEIPGTYPVKCYTNTLNTYYVPETLKKVTLTKYAGEYAFANCVSIEEIVFAESFEDKNIEKYFAYNCRNLKNISLPNNIEFIGDMAFNGCSLIENFDIPKSVSRIYYGAFNDTKWYEKQKEKFVIVGNDVLLKYNGTNTEVIIPENVKCISSAFEGRSDITSVKIGSNVKTIGPRSFLGCTGIEEIYLPKNLELIEKGALTGMCNLRKITVPFMGRYKKEKPDYNYSKLDAILKDELECPVCQTKTCYESEKLEEVTVLGGIIEDMVFYGFAAEKIVLGEGITFIEEYAFNNCQAKEIVFDENIKLDKLDRRTFTGCDNLTTLTIPGGIKNIDAAFTYCENLKKVTILDGVEELNGTFERCTSLEEIVLPDSLKKIGAKTFKDCSSLKEITFGAGLENVDYDAFRDTDDTYKSISAFKVSPNNPYFYDYEGCVFDKENVLVLYPEMMNTSTFYVNKAVSGFSENSTQSMTGISEFVVDENNLYLTAIDGVVYSKDLTRLVRFPTLKSGDYIAPDTVTSVARNAFYKCNLVGKIVFDNNNVSFEEECFYHCEPTELNVPCLEYKLGYYFGKGERTVAFKSDKMEKLVLTNQTKDIPEYFADWYPFKEVELQGDFKEIGMYAFYSSGFTEIRLPDSVEVIGQSAFSHSKLEYISLGESLKSIESGAFSHSDLQEIKFPLSLEAIGDLAFNHTPLLELTLGENVRYIGVAAFSGSKLKKVVVNEKLAGIAERLFDDCYELEMIVLPDAVTDIKENAFTGATKNLTIYCNEGSYAETYAQENNIQYTTLVLDSIENQVYTGEEIKPEVGASANGKRLALDTEYTVDYRNNINAGSAKIIARGLGDFKALIAVGKFTILPKEMENIEIVSQDVEFDPVNVDFKVDVFLGEIQLVKNIDYELVTETKRCDVGENNIAVCGIGNYSGITNITVNVLPRDISEADIETGKRVVVTDKGEELIKDIDYIETRTTDENGKEVIEIKGIGNYDGAVFCSENKSVSINFFDILIEFIQSLVKMLMM